MEYLIDTTFLIGRWRQGKTSPEQRFIDDHPDAAAAMPWIVKAEFLRGGALVAKPAAELEAFLSRYATVWVSETTLTKYVWIYVQLARTNALIGANDLWIAASALEHGIPLLTRNHREFRHVPDLEVIDYVR